MSFDKQTYYEYLNNPDYNTALEAVRLPSYKTFINSAVTSVYPYSNEHLRQLFANLNVYGKSVATVGSSGDQAFNAIYYGADKVTIIDACITAEPYIELKKAAILNFDFETFNKFMTGENIFNPQWYAKISHDLNDSAKMFWDNLFLEGEEACHMEPLTYLKSTVLQKIGSAFYDNPENYQRLQSLLKGKNFEYIQAEFGDFPQMLREKYDLILLSNINTYSEREMFFEVVGKLEKYNLNDGGAIQIHYIFDYLLYDHFLDCAREQLGRDVETVFVEKSRNGDPKTYNWVNIINETPSDTVFVKNEEGLFDTSQLNPYYDYSVNLILEKE